MMTLTGKIRLVNTDKSLSKGAKLLTIEIIIASNFRGYCWHSVAALGEMIAASESQVHRYIKEASEGGWIEVKRRPKKTSLYSLGEKFGAQEQRVSAAAPKIEISKKKNNVLVREKKERPEPTTAESPVDLPMVRKIINETGDRKSLRYWVKVCRLVPESELHEYLSHLRVAMGEKIICHPGGYLNTMILANYPELRKQTVPGSPSASTEQVRPHKKQVLEDNTPASHEESMMAIARIRELLARKAV